MVEGFNTTEAELSKKEQRRRRHREAAACSQSEQSNRNRHSFGSDIVGRAARCLTQSEAGQEGASSSFM
jgi:hypothetical protein